MGFILYYFCLQITLTMDGWQRQEIRLEQPNPATKVETSEGRSSLCVGHVYDELREMTNFLPWQLGSLSLFKGQHALFSQIIDLLMLINVVNILKHVELPFHFFLKTFVSNRVRFKTKFLVFALTKFLLTCSTFPGVDLSEEECLYLYALGPSCRALSKCDGPEQPMTYSTFITKQLIQHSNISHDALVGLRLVDRDQLRVRKIANCTEKFFY